MEKSPKIDIEKAFQELKEKAIEIYPDIIETIDTFNATNIEAQDYFNYLNLLAENSQSITSNHTVA